MPRSLFPSAGVPSSPGGGSGSFEIGVKFKDAVGGFVTALRYWRKASESAVDHTMRLWDAGGTQVASVVVPAGAAEAWNEAELAEPYELTPGATYTVSVGILSTYPLNAAGSWTPPAGTVGGLESVSPGGVFHDPPLGQFPSDAVGALYWADVVVEDDVGPPEDTEAPTAPASLDAAATSATTVSLSWPAATDDTAVTGYLVERCSGTGCIDFVQVTTRTTLSWNNTGLTPETLYRYRVRATDLAGNLGAYSPVATATTQEASSTGALGDLPHEMAAALLAVVGPAVDDVEVQVSGRMLLAPTPPSIDIWLGDPSRDFRTAGFQEVGGEHIFTVRVRVGSVDSIAGQDLLYRLMDDYDPIGVAAALEADQTLAGFASSVYVDLFAGFQLLEGGPDGTGLLGSIWRVRVLRLPL